MKRVLWIIVALIFIFLVGPRVESPSLTWKLGEPNEDLNLLEIRDSIFTYESNLEGLKPGNNSIIYFTDSIPSKSEYCLLYLHGFSASPREGGPVHQEFANRYGMNFYAPLIYGHGLDGANNLYDMTPDRYIESSKKALEVAKRMGEKVIIMATSTGGTMALPLAANNDGIEGLILYSPNLGIYDPAASILTKPWGLHLGKIINGPMVTFDEDEESMKYWQTNYRLEAIAYLQSLVESVHKTSTYENIDIPLMVGYYYKNENEHDEVVQIEPMHEMFEAIRTPKEQKRKVVFENVGNHVVLCDIKSKDLKTVRTETWRFAESVLNLKK